MSYPENSNRLSFEVAECDINYRKQSLNTLYDLCEEITFDNTARY